MMVNEEVLCSAVLTNFRDTWFPDMVGVSQSRVYQRHSNTTNQTGPLPLHRHRVLAEIGD